jgi:putative ABC transport system permease protein
VLTVIGQDFRYALRALARRPTYAAITILVLAIAIGANTTVFSVLNGLFLRPLPYPDGDRLVEVYDSYPKMGIEVAGTAIPDYIERREEAKSLESLAIVTTEPRTLGAAGDPERVRIARASPSLFTVLRTQPRLGRAFTDDEAALGNDRVAVLSDRLWRTRFGASPNVEGLEIRLDGDSFRVIGVMPPGFGFPTRDVDAWTPFAFTPAEMADSGRGNQFSQSVGRLRDGATLETLNAELATIVNRNVEAGRIPRDFVSVAGFTGRAKWLRDTRVGSLESMVYLLQATVLAVLLIACANVANLQLARVASRRRELAVRTALGAPGARLARLVLVESFLLALVGAFAGLVLASGGLELVRALGLDRSNDGFEFRLDTVVLAFTLGAGVLAALVAGLPPLIALLRDGLIQVVHEAGRLGGGGRSANALRSALIVVQIALSVALLAGAGLLTKNFYRLESEGPGFNSGSIWTAGISLPRGRYSTQESWAQFEQRMLVALRALPGVSAAGFTSVLPFSNANTSGSYVVEGYEPPAGTPPPHGQQRSIDEQYLPALGIAIVQGRNFAASEPERVAIVDTNVARKYWPDGKALGQRLRYNSDPPDRFYTIIGVVPPVKQADLAEESKETVYWHYEQRPVQEGRLALRTTLPPEQLTGAVKAAIAQLDPELALFNIEPLDLLVQRSLGIERAPMVLTLVFAAVAFTLAVIGIYGVLTWAVTQRFAEIGVRLALGAQVRDIVRMVLTQGGKLIAIGVAFGIVGAAVIGRVLAAQVPGVAAIDTAVIAGSVVALAAAALIATWLPARRAGRTDPMITLRSD